MMYACWGCGDGIRWPVDVADCYCDLCMALIMFNIDCEEQERAKRTDDHPATDEPHGC
jgi:hypothetical protein